MVLDVTPFQPQHNVDILNAIRYQATPDYQRRIPDATKANIQDVIQKMMDYKPNQNEFINVLINQIGMQVYKNNTWSNPWAKFKIGMLPYGDTIEEVQVGLADAYVYDTDREYLEQTLFGQERPEVQSSFHKLNRQNFYKISINQAVLRRAFQSDTGLSTLIVQLMQAPTTSDQWDEFLVMTSLFKEYYRQNGFYKINVSDITNLSSDSAAAKGFLKKARAIAGNLGFISRDYNAAKMPVSTTADKLELFITPEANASLDVEGLAAAFNIDKANMPSRVNLIPQQHFQIPGVQAILTTSDFFVVADTLFETTSQPNAAGLFTNYYLHHHQIISASRFVPAILFTTQAGTTITLSNPDVNEITPLVVKDADGTTVTTVARGSYYEILGSAITFPSGGLNSAIRLTLSGAVSPRTYITQTGTLSVALDEDATALIVIATAVDDNSYREEVSLTVTGEKANIWPLGTDDLIDSTVVTPAAVTKSGNIVTIPTSANVHYIRTDTNAVLAAGTVTLTATAPDGPTLTFTAQPNDGYSLSNTAVTTWTYTYA